jgi:gas vesicle protein
MTQNTNMTTFVEYNKEVAPKIHSLLKKQEVLKEWCKDDTEIAKFKEQIKEIQEQMKGYIKDTESELVREIEDLSVDIKEAIKAMCKGSDYKPAQVKAFLLARAQQKVEAAYDKAELFTKLEDVLA